MYKQWMDLLFPKPPPGIPWEEKREVIRYAPKYLGEGKWTVAGLRSDVESVHNSWASAELAANILNHRQKDGGPRQRRRSRRFY